VFVSIAVVREKPLPDRQALRSVGALLVISVALAALDRQGWGTLFIFTVVAIAMCVRPPFSFYGVLLCTALCVGSLVVVGAAAGAIIGFATPTLGIGMLMLVVADLRTRNRELHEARTELARLAVADERTRFARDLHDLLGHSLSVIALKAELAGRLLREQPSEAAGHVAEIEQVARGALSEVREAVSGYRQPTLDDEIAGAKMALSAAGIEARIERPAVTLDPAIEAVLAWTVREGATNVIRHSGAGHCSVKVTAGLGEAGVEVVDDGQGRDDAGANGHGGHGLEGLRERVARMHGQIEAGAGAAGGYRLAVRVPVAAP
jgi:two-component system sensor histidine kinase DesK